MILQGKSIHELRAIAQGYNVPDIFAKTDVQLRQAIEVKQTESIPKLEVVIPKPEYDASLMTRPPARISDQETILRLLAPHIARGLRVTFPTPEEWHMQILNREDNGTIRMPPRVVMQCADKLLNAK